MRLNLRDAGDLPPWGDCLIFLPTSCPSPDFYGGERRGDNLYSDSVVALRASTGKLVWYFQVVHHDIWDYDDATAPKLLTVRHDGKTVDAVAQVSKQGFVWVFNRATGGVGGLR